MTGIPPESLCHPALCRLDQFLLIDVKMEYHNGWPLPTPKLQELRLKAEHKSKEL
jgi:hypothetical protein